MILREGQLEFDFTGSLAANKVDGPGTDIPETMKKVDFVVEEAERSLFIEVKDPSDARTTAEGRASFARGLKGSKLINETLVPKCRDTYTFKHLMGEDGKPFIYIVLISLYEHTDKPELFGPLNDKLRSRLRREGKRRWNKPYVADCMVVNVAIWNQKLPYPVTRRTPA